MHYRHPAVLHVSITHFKSSSWVNVETPESLKMCDSHDQQMETPPPLHAADRQPLWDMWNLLQMHSGTRKLENSVSELKSCHTYRSCTVPEDLVILEKTTFRYGAMSFRSSSASRARTRHGWWVRNWGSHQRGSVPKRFPGIVWFTVLWPFQ